MKKIFTSLLLLLGLCATAQVKIGDNPTTVNASAVLEMESTTKGLLLPRMTTAQRNAIASPATGLGLFNTTTGSLEVNTGTPASPVWSSAKAGDVSNITLTSPTSPAGTTVGQMAYNTNASAGLPKGPMYWDGTQWVSISADATTNVNLTSPTSPAGTSVGQVAYNTGSTQPTGLIYWDGTQWKAVNSSNSVPLTSPTSPAGASIGQMAYNTNAASGLAVGPVYWDGTQWQSVKSSSFDATVEVSGLGSGLSSPNSFSGGTFSPNTPGLTSVVYVNTTDGSTWTYNGSQYVSYTASSISNFYLANGTTDAGTNKTSSIYRNGNIGLGTSTPNASAALDITSTTKGFLPPRMTTTQRNAISSPASGLVIFNTSTNSLEINVGTPATPVWTSGSSSGGSGSSTYPSSSMLGYDPSSTATASTSAPTSVSISGITCTRQATGTYSGNGHSYATYSSSAALTFYQAYTLAKNMGGYLATFTSNAEWQYVETNLLSGSIFNTNGCWIGMAKLSLGVGGHYQPDFELRWITGEFPEIDWTYSIANTSILLVRSNWFAGGEPNSWSEGFIAAVGKNYGVTLTKNSYTATHPWLDIAPNTALQTASWGFIVEFQQ